MPGVRREHGKIMSGLQYILDRIGDFEVIPAVFKP